MDHYETSLTLVIDVFVRTQRVLFYHNAISKPYYYAVLVL